MYRYKYKKYKRYNIIHQVHTYPRTIVNMCLMMLMRQQRRSITRRAFDSKCTIETLYGYAVSGYIVRRLRNLESNRQGLRRENRNTSVRGNDRDNQMILMGCTNPTRI
jgi:hypothetical protein